MTRLSLRTMIVLVCLGIVALISITVPQTFSKSLVTPRVSSSLAGASTPIHAKSLMAPRVSSVRLGNSIPIQITAGRMFTCALLSNGNVKCWGGNGDGQLGLGNTTDRGYAINHMGDNLLAVNLGSGRTAVAIQSGISHTCAILDNGSVKCWGSNSMGQLGLGNSANRGDNTGEMGNDLPAVDLGTSRTAKKISLNYNSTCAILDDNTTKCWGYNYDGQLGLGDRLNRGDNTGEMGTDLPTVDLGTNRYAVTISGGASHNCALLDNATVKCWGQNGEGQLGYGDKTKRGIAANQMGDSLATVAVGSGLTVTGIFAGSLSTCVILNNATSKCWGYNSIGQTEYGYTTISGDGPGEMGDDLATLNFGDNTANAFISSSFVNPFYESRCVLLSTGAMTCWGYNANGQLGAGDTTNRISAPNSLPNVNLGYGRSVKQMAFGDEHACAILDNNALKCWGQNHKGQLGYGDTATRGNNPDEMGDNLGSVVMEYTATATLTPSQTLTPTSTSTSTSTSTPTSTSTATPSETLTPSKTYTPSKTSTRSLTPSRSKTPTKSRTRTATPIGGIKEVVAVSTGAEHACAILANDTVVCWGQNSYGQLGYDDSINHGSLMNHMGSNLAAVNLGLGRTAKAIATGYDHTCALLDDNTVKCWGSNDAGQLGYGDTTTRGTTGGDMAALAAIDLGTGRTAIAIAAGSTYTCAILDNKRVKCWGYNSTGELGLGDVSDHGTLPDQMGDYLPYVDLGSGHTAKLIRTGSGHTCVLLDDDTVKCWGYNGDGNLGLGDSNNRGDNPDKMGNNLPNLDFGTRRVQTIAVGGDSACALFDSGAVTCWGYNTTGVLGQGHMNNRGDTENQMGAALLNIDLGSGHTAKAIAINYHACAILDDDTVKCWGGNYMGQLGYGDTSDRGDEGGEMGNDLPTVNLGNDLTAKSVSVGLAFTCAILNTNKLKCWGDNTSGQLGYNNIYVRGNSTDYMGTLIASLAVVRKA